MLQINYRTGQWVSPYADTVDTETAFISSKPIFRQATISKRRRHTTHQKSNSLNGSRDGRASSSSSRPSPEYALRQAGRAGIGPLSSFRVLSRRLE
ncbi:hypothetical protein PRIPAC_93074 [Pristionchus pacificus]|uniref:Uncharacterized protein n=1 Tax=Pristionchus pacificus TaxID=54126 RepID=A0A2A6BAB2_PRIPA|nr:hypothetical protein PRIPAC_93074 [Pristionchus pacificus]|eukprot:PDM62825.1 hypothetical protein PRIPAC_50040 [Pristionchus pacificus]